LKNVEIKYKSVALWILAIAFCFLTNCNSGGDNHRKYIFKDIAPPGGYVSNFAFHPADPDIVYAALDDSGGLYVSRDKGATWASVPLGRRNWSSWDVQVHPAAPEIITICDGYGHGVLRSVNGGATWAERNSGLANQNPQRMIKALALDPQNSSILYIGTGDGVYKSVDGALSWQKSSIGLPVGRQVFRLAMDPANSSHIFAGAAGGEIYASSDGAQNWNFVYDLFPGDNSYEFWDLMVAPSNSSCIIAGLGNRVMLSKSGGAGWSDIASAELGAPYAGLPIGVTAAFDPANADVIYIGTFRTCGNLRLRSDDGGATFADITGALADEGVFRIRVSPHDSQMVLAGLVGLGIERSYDRGATWQLHTGRPSASTAPGDFAAGVSDPSRIYIAASYSIYRSSDGGQAWERTVAPDFLFWKIAVHPQNPDFVLTAPLFLFANGVYRSSDGGDNWEHLNIAGLGVVDILFSGSNANTVYVSAFSFSGGAFGIYRSDDLGNNFACITPPSWYNTIAASQVLEHPAGTGEILAATVNGIYASSGNQSQFDQFALSGKNLRCMAASADGTWVAGGENEAYISRDAGLTWKTCGFPGCRVAAVLLDPDRPGRILLGVCAEDVDFTPESQPGLYLSEDYGGTFKEITTKLYPSDQIYRLAKDHSAQDTYLFSVYSAAGGLYRVVVP
jgi:photosystem II stability/assembly factor-like uncharacterized protein